MSIGHYRRPFSLALNGLAPAPSQVWGSVRLVPLVRERVRADLRVDPRVYEGAGVVRTKDRAHYHSFIPHGLAFRWTEDGSPAAALGTWLGSPEGKVFGKHLPVRKFERMARRESPDTLRLLPLHLAMEGFLALHFAGPEVVWKDYSERAIRQGLSPRVERSLWGGAFDDLADALRLFEIHEDQCGVLLFIGDSFASAMVMPHPADYRLVHGSLVRDFYGELLWQHGRLNREVPAWAVTLDDDIGDFGDLARALARATEAWSRFEVDNAGGLLGREVLGETVYRAGPFTLDRFLTGLVPGQENHLGERIAAPDGELMYLRSYRLSEAQVKRGYLLQQLAEADWHPETAAARLGCAVDELVRRVEKAGLTGLFRPRAGG